MGPEEEAAPGRCALRQPGAIVGERNLYLIALALEHNADPLRCAVFQRVGACLKQDAINLQCPVRSNVRCRADIFDLPIERHPRRLTTRFDARAKRAERAGEGAVALLERIHHQPQIV